MKKHVHCYLLRFQNFWNRAKWQHNLQVFLRQFVMQKINLFLSHPFYHTLTRGFKIQNMRYFLGSRSICFLLHWLCSPSISKSGFKKLFVRFSKPWLLNRESRGSSQCSFWPGTQVVFWLRLNLPVLNSMLVCKMFRHRSSKKWLLFQSNSAQLQRVLIFQEKCAWIIITSPGWNPTILSYIF